VMLPFAVPSRFLVLHAGFAVRFASVKTARWQQD